jgi:hypothetical protein
MEGQISTRRFARKARRLRKVQRKTLIIHIRDARLWMARNRS